MLFINTTPLFAVQLGRSQICKFKFLNHYKYCNEFVTMNSLPTFLFYKLHSIKYTKTKTHYTNLPISITNQNVTFVVVNQKKWKLNMEFKKKNSILYEYCRFNKGLNVLCPTYLTNFISGYHVAYFKTVLWQIVWF